ncbi:hypothetical protein HYX12_03540 [Candidatus Woesearchaeota archaeon]|nr:hypothetical protein [Candidatus Woesearchaeota archaeon]
MVDLNKRRFVTSISALALASGCAYEMRYSDPVVFSPEEEKFLDALRRSYGFQEKTSFDSRDPERYQELIDHSIQFADVIFSPEGKVTIEKLIETADYRCSALAHIESLAALIEHPRREEIISLGARLSSREGFIGCWNNYSFNPNDTMVLDMVLDHPEMQDRLFNERNPRYIPDVRLLTPLRIAFLREQMKDREFASRLQVMLEEDCVKTGETGGHLTYRNGKLEIVEVDNIFRLAADVFFPYLKEQSPENKAAVRAFLDRYGYVFGNDENPHDQFVQGFNKGETDEDFPGMGLSTRYSSLAESLDSINGSVKLNLYSFAEFHFHSFSDEVLTDLGAAHDSGTNRDYIEDHQPTSGAWSGDCVRPWHYQLPNIVFSRVIGGKEVVVYLSDNSIDTLSSTGNNREFWENEQRFWISETTHYVGRFKLPV